MKRSALATAAGLLLALPGILAIGHGAARATPIAHITHQGSHDVTVIDRAARTVQSRVKVGTPPFGLRVDERRERLHVLYVLYVLSVLNVRSDDVSVIGLRNMARPTVIATIEVGKAPCGAALASQGALLCVSNQHDDSVSVIDTATGQFLRTIATGRNSRGFGAFIGAPQTP